MALIQRTIHRVFIQNLIGRPTIYRSDERFASSETAASNSLVVESQDLDFEDEKERAAAALEAKRNKSRLNPKHYNLIHGELPVDLQNPKYPYEKSIVYRRKLASRFGSGTGINLGISWPTKDEVQEWKEYESAAHPFTIPEMVEKKRKLREEETARIMNRQKEIELKMGKLAGWMKELKDRKMKKEAVVRAAQEKKDKLIEEVRQHFGYVVSMKDPKFQEMLEKKEKETKKAEKELKKKVKQDETTMKILAEANKQAAKTPTTATDQSQN